VSKGNRGNKKGKLSDIKKCPLVPRFKNYFNVEVAALHLDSLTVHIGSMYQGDQIRVNYRLWAIVNFGQF
jgi:hypothetical protein